MARKQKQRGIVAVDTETTGLDLRHGCLPFFVSTCAEDGVSRYWEWEVDPETREPRYDYRDWEEIAEYLNGQEQVYQNAKFDCRVFEVGDTSYKILWNWDLIHDTHIAGHVVNSREQHDLTSMALNHLSVDIEPYEKRLGEACNRARNIARSKYPTWKIAKEESPGLPSAKSEGKLWKYDMWLPYAVAKAEGYLRGECEVVNVRRGPYDVMIDRTTRWGNPFVIGRDGTREEVIAKYRRWLLDQPWIKREEVWKELDGKRLGCHCKPAACHGDVIAELLRQKAHPWWTVLREYANADPVITLRLWQRFRQRMEEDNLWELYLLRMKQLRVAYAMESRGMSYHIGRLNELQQQYEEESREAEAICLKLAEGHIEKLPKQGTSNALNHTLFEFFGLEPVQYTEKGKPSTNTASLEHWEAFLPRGSRAKAFVTNLAVKRKRDTALSFLASYRRFGVPFNNIYRLLFPSLNIAATHTLRGSSTNPNGQNLSKKPGFNLRYIFGPLPGREWWALDYENIELRIPAYEAGEREMIDLFEKPDEPPYFGSNHLLVSHILHPAEFEECLREGVSFKERYKATLYQWVKNGNFATQYGAVEESGTADAAYHVLGAQARIKSRFQMIAQLNDRCIEFAQRHGYIETLVDKEFGRGYPLWCEFYDWGTVKPTIPLNYRVSGTAMWCMARAMVRCYDAVSRWEDVYISNQVHDELLFDFPAQKNLGNLPRVLELKRLMEESGNDVGIPLKVSVTYHPRTYDKGEDIHDITI